MKVSAEDLKEGDTRVTNAARAAQEKIGTQAGFKKNILNQRPSFQKLCEKEKIKLKKTILVGPFFKYFFFKP